MLDETIMEGIRRHIQPIGGLEHARLLEIQPGLAKVSVEIGKENLNLYGNLHGGFLFALCDMAAGMAAYAYGMTNVTMQGSLSFIRGVQGGTRYAEAVSQHRGRSTVVNRVTVRDEEGRLVADGTYTMFLTGNVGAMEGSRSNPDPAVSARNLQN